MALISLGTKKVSLGTGSDICSIVASKWLDPAEILTGTPIVEEQTTADLTLDNKTINSVGVTVLGKLRAAGHVVQFRFSGGTVGTTYEIHVEATTNAALPRTFKRKLLLEH